MKKPSRLILYVLINIIVSALTTLTVLWLWERAHPTPEPPQPTETTPVPNRDVTENSTTNPESENSTELLTEEIQIVIRAVVGAGNLDSEYVEVYNESNGAVDLTGWQLVDEEGHRFTFPALILNSEGAVEVHSKTGEHTVIKLYWQADSPIWQSGEIVKLVDAGGDIMATYSIP